MRCICLHECARAYYSKEDTFPREAKILSVLHNKTISSNCRKFLKIYFTGRVISTRVQSKELDEKNHNDLRSKFRARIQSDSSFLNAERTEKYGKTRKSEEINHKSRGKSGRFKNEDEFYEAADQNPWEEPKFDGDDDNAEYVTKIPVSRQRYISVSKMALVRSLLSNFSTKAEASNFLSICSCLESILHAEHKLVLEELRLDYKLTSFSEKEKLLDAINLGQITITGNEGPNDAKNDHKTPQASNGAAFSSKIKYFKSFSMMKKTNPAATSGNTLAARFQQNFMLILKSAQFQELSARDLQLTTALNSNYLLTLPIDIDWKSASSENMIVFRRGYGTETQSGLLFGEKFDYLQSLLLRKIFNGVARPLFRVGRWCIRKWKLAEKNPKGKAWTEGIKRWLEEPLYPYLEDQEALSEDSSLLENDQTIDYDYDSTIWIAAQRAMPRYEAVLSSAGSRGILLKRFLIWIGILPSNTSTFPFLSSGVGVVHKLEPHLRTNHLSRVSMKDIWLPASKSICGDDILKRLKESLRIFFSSSTLQEPAFEELVVLYTKASDATKRFSDNGLSMLKLNIYKKIPIPDLKVIFPNKKLSFRIVDLVRLDITTVVGIIAFLVNYKFVDLLSSPSAFLLDVITSISLLVFASRVTFGYKQTWDRYQLLVNKTLYEKTLASGFGAVHFLVDASEEQQFKEVILAYGLLLQDSQHEEMSWRQLKDTCERFVYDKFNEKIEMHMEDVAKNLSRLGLINLEQKHSKTVSNNIEDQEEKVKCRQHSESLDALQKKWKDLLTFESIWSSRVAATYPE